MGAAQLRFQYEDSKLKVVFDTPSNGTRDPSDGSVPCCADTTGMPRSDDHTISSSSPGKGWNVSVAEDACVYSIIGILTLLNASCFPFLALSGLTSAALYAALDPGENDGSDPPLGLGYGELVSKYEMFAGL